MAAIVAGQEAIEHAGDLLQAAAEGRRAATVVIAVADVAPASRMSVWAAADAWAGHHADVIIGPLDGVALLQDRPRGGGAARSARGVLSHCRNRGQRDDHQRHEQTELLHSPLLGPSAPQYRRNPYRR